MKTIDPCDLTLKPADLFLNRWLLLTAGNIKHFNAMTIAWGSIGAMWERPFVQVVVRPVRYTYEFINRYPTFTLCAFPEGFRKALTLMGTKSGREGDKIAAAGLTPLPSKKVEAPCYREAELVIECRKVYMQDLDPAQFLDKRVAALYPNRDYHRVFFGEIVSVSIAD